MSSSPRARVWAPSLRSAPWRARRRHNIARPIMSMGTSRPAPSLLVPLVVRQLQPLLVSAAPALSASPALPAEHEVSAPAGSSPAAREVPAAHVAHTWFATCSFAAHGIAPDGLVAQVVSAAL